MNEARLPASDMTHALPLFPLPEYTLFPNTLVPFHVYERTYQAMLGDCLGGRRLLVVAGLAPGWEADSGEPPPTQEICGLGRILSDRSYPDGRFDLFVHGIARVRITRHARVRPWCEVDVEHLPDRPTAAPDAAYRRLVGVTARLRETLGEDDALLGEILASSREAGVLANRLASLLVDDYPARQRLLGELCPVRRSESLVERVASLLLRSDGPLDDAGGWVN